MNLINLEFRARTEGAVLWNSTGISELGLLKDGCSVGSGSFDSPVNNNTVVVRFDKEVEADGYFFVTPPGDPANDVAQWVIFATHDNETTWEQVIFLFSLL